MGVVPSVPARRRLRERRGVFPLRYHLIALVVIALVPTLIFAGIVVGSLGREQRASVENGLQTTVRALAIATDGSSAVTAWSRLASGRARAPKPAPTSSASRQASRAGPRAPRTRAA